MIKISYAKINNLEVINLILVTLRLTGYMLSFTIYLEFYKFMFKNKIVFYVNTLLIHLVLKSSIFIKDL